MCIRDRLESVYAVIVDRMKNPKEDSYTNAVMEKGIDKILKKLGHECTEIILAAKNPDSDDLKFEISDFMYHLSLIHICRCKEKLEKCNRARKKRKRK